MSNANEVAPNEVPLSDLLGPLPERVAAAGCPPPDWVAPSVVPSLVGRLYTQADLDAAVAAERERCAKLCDAIGDGEEGWTTSVGAACAAAIRAA